MTVKSTWGTNDKFTSSDSNAVATDLNAATAKLATVASGATANDTDSNLKARTNHTGQQPSSTISDFTEAVQDAVAALLAQGTNVTLTYNDAGNTLTVAAGGGGGLDAEAVRDAIGVAMVGTGVISVTVNDAADTITITSTATANDTDANLKARANHTGTQSADTITDGSTNKAYTATEKTKLASIDSVTAIPRVLKWSGSAWPDRPSDSRVTFFIGGATATDAPADADLANGDVWIPAS